MEEFRLHREKGVEVYGFIENPQCKQAMIICHGLGSFSGGRTVTTVAAPVAAKCAAVRFDFRGNGKSTDEAAFAKYERDLEDLRAVVLYLRERGYDVRAIAGHSKGGTTVVMYLFRYGDVPYIVNISGRIHMSRPVPGRFTESFFQSIAATGEAVWEAGTKSIRVTKDDLEERDSLAVLPATAPRDTRTVLITIHGEADTIVPAEDAIDLHRFVADLPCENGPGSERDAGSPSRPLGLRAKAHAPHSYWGVASPDGSIRFENAEDSSEPRPLAEVLAGAEKPSHTCLLLANTSHMYHDENEKAVLASIIKTLVERILSS